MIQLEEKTKKLIIPFVILSAAFLLLRLRSIGHLLMWDEAWNMLALRAVALDNPEDVFYWFYFFHPPLYMFFAKFLFPFAQGFDIRLEFLSLFFAYGTFSTVYFLSKRIGGWKYALFSGISLAFLPVCLGYDTWIKRDNPAILLGYLAILLLLNKRFFWCTLSLALSLLSKENGIFFVLAACLMVFVMREEKPVRKIFLMLLGIFLFSSWWYLFFSEMTKVGPGYFFTEADYSLRWAQELFYYFKKLYYDIGPVNILLLLTGLIFIIFKVKRTKEDEWFTSPVIFLSVYLPITFLFVLKSPWLSFPAAPALAMIIGAALLGIFNMCRRNKLLKSAFYLLVILSILPGMLFSYSSYHQATYPHGWPGAKSSRDIAMYLNENMDDDDTFLITEFAYWRMPICAIFHYYIQKEKFKLTSLSITPEQLIRTVKKDKISYLVIVGSPDLEKGRRSLELSRGVYNILGEEPEKVGWCYVWNTKGLWKK